MFSFIRLVYINFFLKNELNKFDIINLVLVLNNKK